jgi:FAD synthetase
VLARDETVKQVKGKYPENNEKIRLKAVSQIKEVDKAILGDKKDKYLSLKKFLPDIIVLGYDQFVFTYKLPKLFIDLNLNAEIVRINSFKPEIFKSSLIKKNKKF